MYRELEEEEGKQLVINYTKTYTCMQEEEPIYTKEKLDKFYAYPFNTVTFQIVTENTKGVVGFIDDNVHKHRILVWVNHNPDITNEDELREGIREAFQLFSDYTKMRNRSEVSTRVVKWKDYKPVWRGLIANWKEIMTEVADEFFVDFKIEEEEVRTFKVK